MRLRAKSNGRTDPVRALTAQVSALTAQMEEQWRASSDELARLRDDIASARDSIWASKVVSIGDRLLVGCRHLNLVYYIDPTDRLIGPRFIVDGEYEPATTAFVLHNVGPDDTCIDVGANFGYYSCMFAHLAWRGRVLAFEADPLVHRTLVDNVAINWSEGVVQPINAAVGSEVGELTLHRWINRPGNTGIIPPDHEIAPGFRLESERFEVAMIPLDSLIEHHDRVDLVKVDVEGAESLVVKGMTKLVNRFRPIVIIEWSPYQIRASGSSVDELASLLEEWGVSLHTINNDGTLESQSFDRLPGLPFQNIVLAPDDRIRGKSNR